MSGDNFQISSDSAKIGQGLLPPIKEQLSQKKAQNIKLIVTVLLSNLVLYLFLSVVNGVPTNSEAITLQTPEIKNGNCLLKARFELAFPWNEKEKKEIDLIINEQIIASKVILHSVFSHDNDQSESILAKNEYIIEVDCLYAKTISKQYQDTLFAIPHAPRKRKAAHSQTGEQYEINY